MDNLWGDLSEIKTIRTPQKILNEQASYLNGTTKNKIIASLIKTDDPITFLSERDADFKFDFVLTSPSIKGYKYKIFRIYHNVQIYPLYIKIEESLVDEIAEELININLDDEPEIMDLHDYCEYEILNEETFINSLRVILSSNTVRRVISSLSSLADTM